MPHNGRFNLVTLTVVENGSVSDDLLLHLIDHSPRLTGLALAYSPAASPASLGSLSAVALERALLSCAQRLNSLVCILNRGSVPPDALGAQAGQFDRLLGRVLPSFTELELLSVCDGVVDTSTFLALPKCIRVIRLHVYGVMVCLCCSDRADSAARQRAGHAQDRRVQLSGRAPPQLRLSRQGYPQLGPHRRQRPRADRGGVGGDGL